MPPKILAPPETMASQSFYRYRGQDRLSVSVFLGFSLLESERAIEIASALKGAMDSLAPYAPQGVPFDLGLPKPRGEFLAAGEAFAPYGSEERAMAVSFAVGSLRRDFLAMGAQAERGPKPGPPAPFKFQPLSWSATAHCEEWNPIGVKPGEPLAPGGPPIHGPLVTEADYDREGRVTQAAFGPNAPASPLPMANPPGRLKAIGSFGPDWLLTAAPGLPDDFDWDFFNLAQKGQRLPQGYFRGDERVQVANGHSHYPHFDVRLPGYAPRLFVHQKSAPERFLEVRPDLDTVWLFPSASMGLLIWRAQLSVEDELASDVYSVFVGLEKIGQNSLDPRELAEGALNGLWPAIPLAVAVPADPFAPLPEIAPAAPPEEPLEDPAPSAAVPAASPPSPPPVPPAPLASLAAPLALAPAALLDPALTAKAKAASIIGESRKIMTEELPSVNETLREMGLPELTLESLEPHFQSEEARLTKVLENSQMAEAKAPLSPDDAFAGQKDADDDLAESLMAYGIDPERAKGISLAAALPIPQEATFETAGAYELAMKEYGLEWAALMGVSPVDGLKQAKKLKAAALLAGDPTNPAAMSALLGSGPAEALAAANPLAVSEEMAFMEALKPLGLEPKAASDLFQGIEQYDAALSQSSQMALAEREKLSLELGQKLESALG
ncbi:MAG: DUF2169 domain-containing protein, partial [Deltaproteobacteria bacterium]|nr:DUF2169 domain-containing protein [Deltaproteobacteria bacterium]